MKSKLADKLYRLAWEAEKDGNWNGARQLRENANQVRTHSQSKLTQRADGETYHILREKLNSALGKSIF